MRTRILYWFRTPPGVKVGRNPLDDDAVRQIERLNPDIEFDWPRIFKGQGVPASEPRPHVPRESTREQMRPPRGQAPSGGRPQNRDVGPTRPAPPGAPPSAGAPPSPGPPQSIDASDLIPADGEPAVEPIAELPAPDVAPVPAEPGVEAGPAAPPLPVPVVPEHEIVAHRRLGAEGVQQLRQRYAELLVRIPERVPDPVRQDELKQVLERLNPDAWLTDDAVALALEQYEAVLASLREVVGSRRRRRRKPVRGAPVSGAADAAQGGDDEGEDSGSGGL